MNVSAQLALMYLGKFINTLTLKKNNKIYISPHTNCKSDKYDLCNNGSDNALLVTDYILKNYTGERITIFLECYDDQRRNCILDYIHSVNNDCVEIIPVESCWGKENGKTFSNALLYLNNSIKRYQCKVWVCDTGWSRMNDKLSCQKVINYNYCTPFKKGMIFHKKLSFNYIDYLCETSMMCAKVVSSEYHIEYEKIQQIGFARNDTILGSSKKKEVEKWLNDLKIRDKLLIVYVPTYRPNLVDFSNLNIFGFSDGGELDRILAEKNAVIITKLHPLQRKYLAKLPEGCISFEPTYEFSIYDLFSYASIMVSDYSSISTDYLISGKPVIYLFSDIDEYDRERGFSFEPIESVCCGEIAYNWSELKQSIIYAIDNPKMYTEPYIERVKMWHKYLDDTSTKRSYELLMSVLQKIN